MRSLYNDLIQYNWSACKKRKFGHKHTLLGTYEDREDGQLVTKKRGFRRNSTPGKKIASLLLVFSNFPGRVNDSWLMMMPPRLQ